MSTKRTPISDGDFQQMARVVSSACKCTSCYRLIDFSYECVVTSPVTGADICEDCEPRHDQIRANLIASGHSGTLPGPVKRPDIEAMEVLAIAEVLDSSDEVADLIMDGAFYLEHPAIAR